METFDLIVIGSGPGGYVAAIRAAQLGLKVACIEKAKTLGGTCLNVGCIPSKALLYSTEHFERWLHQGKELGIESEKVTANWPQMQHRKQEIVGKLVEGVAYLFKKNKVTWIQGFATFLSSTTLKVSFEKEEHIVEGKRILLATGSEPIPLPFLPFDEKIVLSSTGALVLSQVPPTLLMVGAGVIGLELGSVYQRLGSKVIVIELLDRVCPTLDKEISSTVYHLFKKQGMQFYLSSQVTKGEVKEGKVVLQAESTRGEKVILEASAVLVAIGRRPFTQGLGLELAGVRTDPKGRIVVDGFFRTSQPHIFAIGDVIEGPMLAHKASEEGVAVAEYIAGRSSHVNYLAIPNVMYTWPEAACVGMTEEEAKAAGRAVKIGRFPFRANARARCSNESEGLVKIVVDEATDRILGLHIVGPNASEMIGEGVLALQKKMTVHELAYASHAHPTLSEAIKEAALDALGSKIHL